jgi:CBS domain-containing protein
VAGRTVNPRKETRAMTVNAPIEEILHHKGCAVWSIRPDATVFEAIQLMADKNIGAVLVMAGERLVGVMTERDYTRKVALRGRSSRETPVREIITTPAITVTREQTVEDCMRLMTANRVRHLPVLEGNRVVGIISIGDVVNWTISAQTVAIHQLESYISGQYPG